MGWKDTIQKDPGMQSPSQGGWKNTIRPETPNDISQMQSLGSGVAEGLGGGFTDELGAAGKALMDTVTGITSPEDTLENYRRQRDLLRQEFKKNTEANPKTNFVGNLLGSVALPANLLGETKPGFNLATAGTGAALGGIAGLGGSEADLTKSGNTSQALTDTATGAAMGGLTGPILSGLLNKLSPESLQELAQRRAVKATGIAKPQYKNLMKNNQVGEIGQRLLDEGVVTPLANPGDILERSQDLKQKAGSQISDVINTLDNSGVVSTMPDPTKAATEIESQLKPKLTNPQGAPYQTTKAQNTVVDNILEDIKSHGNTPITFEEAQAFKQMLKQAAYNGKGEVVDENAHKAYGIVNKWIENAAEQTAENSSQPGLLDKYINAKKNYNTGIQAENASFNKEAASAVNRDLGLTDYVAGAAGAAAHGTPGGLAAAGFNKIAKTYGNSLMATGANATSKIFSMPKQGLQQVAQYLSTQGETGQKLGQLLNQAAERDDVGKNALIFTLMQQTPYRDLLNTHFNSEENTNVGQ